MNKFIPDMGHIVLDPKILMKSIYNKRFWLYCIEIDNKPRIMIYDGTGLGLYSGNEIDECLFWCLLTNKFIELDSGNCSTREEYYVFNRDYDVTLKDNNNFILTQLKRDIENNNFKEKYKKLIRKHKLERVLN